MRPPDLLATKWGRLTAFFFLYLTEGIPLGFVATAVATQLRRQGVGPAEIGAFVGSFYLPWSFKFLAGPFVDVFSSDRWGRRRMWIVVTQTLMVVTLLATVGVNLPGELKVFTLLLLVHNAFAATQDVAIDALAVNVLKEHERGLANGVMFGAAYLGQTIGGSAVLAMMDVLSFKGSVVFVAAAIAAVTLLIALPMKEPRFPRVRYPGTRLQAVGSELKTFLRQSAIGLFGSGPAIVGLLVAILPLGAMSLGLALQSNLGVELGLSDGGIAKLNFWSAVISAAGCVVGGQLSDRFGRKRTLALFSALMAIPVAYLGLTLQANGWVLPVDMKDPGHRTASAALVSAFWTATLTYNVFNGLMYGIRTAMFMDITNPVVAATQFTAYMALLNLCISYTSTWQGMAIERWGYPITLFADAALGMLAIALLPFVGSRKPAPATRS